MSVAFINYKWSLSLCECISYYCIIDTLSHSVIHRITNQVSVCHMLQQELFVISKNVVVILHSPCQCHLCEGSHNVCFYLMFFIILSCIS